MNSPRTAAKLCWIFTIISFVGVGIGLYTTINTITYISLGALVIFMIILPMFVCRCPYCGTRRVRQSDRVPNPTPGEDASTPSGQRAAVNARWQMIFGGILLVAVILAVVVLVSLSLNGGGTVKTTPTLPPADDNTEAPATATPSPTPVPTPTPAVQSVTLYYGGEVMADDITLASGTPLTATIWVAPVTVTVAAEDIIWESSDPSIVKVEVDSEDPKFCTFTPVSAGSCEITVTVYGQSDKVIVRYAG